jgi:predicted membrane-bound dolichyl-phosphate-mannose-protein mannosyltransferase
MSSLFKAVVYGAASVVLYLLLYLYADETVELARRTHEGERIWFLVPIVIAFVFSYVHGAFTGHFWDAIGLSPAGKKRRK